MTASSRAAALLAGCLLLVSCGGELRSDTEQRPVAETRPAAERRSAAEPQPEVGPQSDGGSEASPSSPDLLDDVVEWIGELNLEEADSSFVAEPNLRVDPAGGWLYWDSEINQARIYDRNGRLEAILGRPGDGPGEFRRVQSLVRLDDGRLVSVDRVGRIAAWDPTTHDLLEDFTSELRSVFGAVALPGTTILVATSPRVDPSGAAGPVLHVVDIDEGRVVSSGFRPPSSVQSATAMGTVAPNAPRHTDDSIYVGLPIYDTVWALPRAARNPDPKPRSVSSRGISANAPPVSNSQGFPAFRAWAEQSTFFGGYFPVSSRGFLVYAWGFKEGRARNVYHFLNPAGTWQWEVESSLSLLEVDRTGLLYFWDRDGLVPSRIRIGRLK